MIRFKTLLKEYKDPKFNNDIEKMAGIINAVLNNKSWNDGMVLNFKQNKKVIKDYVESQINPHEYNENIKEDLAKAILEILGNVEKADSLPQRFVDKKATYFDIKSFAKWEETAQQLGQIFRQNLDKTDIDLHGDMIITDSIE